MADRCPWIRASERRFAVGISIVVVTIMVLSSMSLLTEARHATSVGSAFGFQLGTPVGPTASFHAGSFPNGHMSPYCGVSDEGVLSTPTSSSPLVLICYNPQDLRAAYNFPGNLDGRGQTIVVIDPFGNPTVQHDLDMFDAAFNIPPTTIQIVCEGGVCPTFNASDPMQVGATSETDQDTQYAHAMAPGAHIVLFEAQSDDDLSLEQAALGAVIMFPHSIISQSFGDFEPDMIQGTCFLGTDTPSGVCSPAYVRETLATGEAAYILAALEGTTVFAGSGDWGADNSPFGYTTANPLYPSSSPWVTAVGGTMGNPYYGPDTIPSCGTARTCSTGLVTFLNTPACQLDTITPTPTASCTPVGYGGEQVWNEPVFDVASGGAPSAFFGVPAYQHGLGLPARATPDVSFNAAGAGANPVYWSLGSGGPGYYPAFGTSQGSPCWAAIAALADQLAATEHRGTVGFINPALYEIGNNPYLYQRDFHDITVGNNIVYGSPDNVGFSASPGWDEATGWGTPNVANLVVDLVALSG
ncbi:MAG: hypothetical protein ACLP8Y_06895 [Thermoplasmata archaeon]